MSLLKLIVLLIDTGSFFHLYISLLSLISDFQEK